MSVCQHRPGEAVLADNGDVIVDENGIPLRRRDFFSYATAVSLAGVFVLVCVPLFGLTLCRRAPFSS